MTTPAKSELDAARERLEEACKWGEGIEASLGWKVFEASQPHRPISTGVHASDLRLVLDALKEAERPRHEIAFAYSMKHGWPICGKCGLVIHDDSPYCSERLPSIDTRDSAKERQ